jgi:hypothetical protein
VCLDITDCLQVFIDSGLDLLFAGTVLAQHVKGSRAIRVIEIAHGPAGIFEARTGDIPL